MNRRSSKITLNNNVYSTHSPPNRPPDSPGFAVGAYADLVMYKYTFASKVAYAAAFVLCVSLLLQPVANAYANETPENLVDSPEVVEIVEVSVPSEEVESDIEDETVEAADVEVLDVGEQTKNTVDQLIGEDVDVVNEELDTTDGQELTDPEVATTTASTTDTENESESSVASSTTPAELLDAETTATSTATSSEQTTDDADGSEDGSDGGSNTDSDTSAGGSSDSAAAQSESGTSTEQVSGDESDDANASTTDETTEPTVQEVSVVHSDQAFAFNRSECTEVEDGSFYCQKASDEQQPNDGLFAAPDNSGDMEIYVVQDGVEQKLTDNLVEDASPYFDVRSNTMVWHRLLNDRYQIISYDIDSGEETQLTNTRVNNMEPSRSGDYTVWQRWVGNNWEIILFDGQIETQLTD